MTTPAPFTVPPSMPTLIESPCTLVVRPSAQLILQTAPQSGNFACVRNSESLERRVLVLKAIASPVRLQVLEWLKEPVVNFPSQVDGDLVVDGVCSDFIADKLGFAASTTSRHLTVLTDANLLLATRKRGWTFYRRNEPAIEEFTTELPGTL